MQALLNGKKGTLFSTFTYKLILVSSSYINLESVSLDLDKGFETMLPLSKLYFLLLFVVSVCKMC